MAAYTDKVDRLIYGEHGEVLRDFDPTDWVDLCLAALDQSGASIEVQNQVEAAVAELYKEQAASA